MVAALDHYLVEAPRAASALAVAFEATVTAIGKAPAAGSPRYAQLLDVEGLRHRKISRFPYLVFYVEGPAAIAIVRVLHEGRDIPSVLVPE